MLINVLVTLGTDDVFGSTPDDAAAAVLAALGGDPTSDACYLSVQQAAVGLAGTDTTIKSEVAPVPPPVQEAR